MRVLRIVMLLVVCLAGCGQTALKQAKVAGLAAKEAAETAYLTVRIEYLLGHVDDATMARARSLYARFEMAQKAYVAAIQLWEHGAPQPENLDQLRKTVADLAASLHAIALEITEKDQDPTTTRPAGGPDDA